MPNFAKHKVTQSVALIGVLAFVFGFGYFAKAVHDDKWELLYEARREFARMPDVRIVSETYSEDVFSLDMLEMVLEVEHKGILEMVINYPGGFHNERQFFITRLGDDCTPYIELRQTIRYAIDNFTELRHSACPYARP